MKQHLFITDVSQIDELKHHDAFTAICQKCGVEYTINDFRLEPDRLARYRVLLCQPCYSKYIKNIRFGNPNYNNRDKAKQTCIEVYGVENPLQCESVKAKAKRTCMEIYGVENPNKSEIVREKIKNTSMARYGTTCSLANKEINDKARKTMNERYGVNYTGESPELRKKMQKTSLERYGEEYYNNRELYKLTSLERYGVENVWSLPEIRKTIVETRRLKYGDDYCDVEKLKATNMERYGAPCVFQAGSIKDNIEKTNKEKYNNSTFFGSEEHKRQIPEYFEKMKDKLNDKYDTTEFDNCKTFSELMSVLRKICPELFQPATRMNYFGLTFDSTPEFCVYIFCFYNGIPIIRNCKGFPYKDIKGKTHHVYPDFVIAGQYVEVKGAHFFKPDGTMWLPYRYPEWDDERYEYESSIYESKRQCLIKNGVIVIKDTDPWVQMCVNWVKTFFGNFFIWQYTKNTFENVSYGYNPFNCDQNKEYQESVGLGLTPFNCDQNKEFQEPIGLGEIPFDIVMKDEPPSTLSK